MQFRITAPMKRRLTPRLLAMIERSVRLFPELRGAPITIGYTRKHLGSATVVYRRGIVTRMVIRLRARRVKYQTIGHELTHLIQGLAQGRGARPAARAPAKIPAGERQCDIWTLARDSLFCDDAPTYLELPRKVRERWPEYAEEVRGLCIAAIEKRHTNRFYIRWLEDELHSLASTARAQPAAARQLAFPFARAFPGATKRHAGPPK
jgi:hypothetical protein